MREVDFDLPPSLEPRLQGRYQHLVQEHLHASQALTPGASVLPGAASALACTQAAWRFYSNANVSPGALMEPILGHASKALEQDCQHYGLVADDWSCLAYNDHASKEDRVPLKNNKHRGYELQTSLLLSDRDGHPIAPLAQDLRAQPGLYSTRCQEVLRPAKHLDDLTQRMEHLESLGLKRPLVHIVDREADSVGHYRQWHQRRFLVRAKGRRRVEWQGQSRLLSAVVSQLQSQGAFKFARQVEFKGRSAQQSVAQTQVVLKRAARPKHKGKSSSVPGPAVSLRLVVSQIRSEEGRLLATWLLLSNLEESVSAEELALWYYWRWRVESFFKLLKSAGHQVEHWQQQTGAAIARRLLVASMACVVVWQLARDPSPEAEQSRKLLVRLSGRQMRRGRSWTTPALLDGLWVLLAMLDLLEHEDMGSVKTLLRSLAPILRK
jgi:Transposase DDE domain